MPTSQTKVLTKATLTVSFDTKKAVCGFQSRGRFAPLNIYGLINKVPENIRFFCTPCCVVISTILEVNVKFDNLEGKLCKTLEDIQARLSDQFKALELKLQKFEVID